MKNKNTPDPDAVLFLVSRLQERAFRFISSELKNRGIKGIEPSHGVIIRQLSIHGPLSMSRLAQLIDRTKPTVSVLIKKMENHGYVKRVPDPDDNRVTIVQLTGKAIDLNEEFRQVSKLMRERIFGGFSPAERLMFAEYLERAIGNFKGK